MSPIRTLDGREVQLLPGVIEKLRRGWSGQVLTPEAPDYDDARAIWNGMIDRRPALILRCGTALDVQRAVRFVAEHQLLSSVRGGGHHIAGNAVSESGVMIDLSLLRTVTVDPAHHRAHAEGGCLLSDLDGATQAYGLATPLGINSTTGLAGLTLGGGYGWLTRRWGLTLDNLLSADVVTAEGEAVHADEVSHPDLFWALRGGSGNFGVVTRLEYNLHPVGPEVIAGLIVHPLEDAARVLGFWREFTASHPEDLAVWAVLRKAPPLPFLPDAWHGREILVLAVCYSGSDHARGERVLAPLRAFGKPIADVVGPQPFAAWQQAFDPLLTPGARNYWKSHDFTRLDDALIELLVERARGFPTAECEIFLGQLGGAAGRVPVNRTAFAHRGTQYVMNVHTRWQDAGQDAECIGWARDLYAAVTPFASGSVYVNFLPEDQPDGVAATYGASYPRLAEIKRQYDPANLFRMNHNIVPAARPATVRTTPKLKSP